MARVCVDACFLIGLYDENDERHARAVQHFAAIFGASSARNILVVPWPILYECCGSKQAKSTKKTSLLRDHWSYLHRLGQLVLLDDRPFREGQLEMQLEEHRRPLSLVDRVLRAMILDPKRPFDAFLTYNTGDFVDACYSSGTHLINEKIAPASYGI